MRIASSSSSTGQDRHHRAEDLLAGDAHVGRDVAEDRRLHVPAVGQLAARAARRRTAASRPRPARSRRTRMTVRSCRSETSGPSRTPSRSPGPSGPGPDARQQPLGERLQHGALHEHAARRRALLAGARQRGDRDLLGGVVEVGVVEHDARVLAAELELHLDQPLGADHRQLASDLGRARERDAGDAAGARQARPVVAARAVHDVDHAGRQCRRAAASAITWHDSGVSVDGLRTTVLPAQQRGRELARGIAMGTFHGVSSATTPSGSRRIESSTPGRADGSRRPPYS